MTILAVGPWRGKPLDWNGREPTLTEILSDSIVRAVMDADRVDPGALEEDLRRMARTMPAAIKPTGRVLACCGSGTTMPHVE